MEEENLDITQEDIKLFCWRVKQLTRAGYDADIAATLATYHVYDWDTEILRPAIELKTKGCKQRHVLRILAPLPR